MSSGAVSGRTLWELIEKRADATPDALMAVDEDMATMTFLEFATEAERAAAGFADYGMADGSVVSWQLPTWIDSLVLVAALSRLGAVQNPILPIYRDREVGFCTEQAHSQLLIVPSIWNGFDFESMATDVSRANNVRALATFEDQRAADPESEPDNAARPVAMQVLVSDRTLPQGDPTRLPPMPAQDDSTVRWLFYTSGTTADPKGAMHTDASLAAVAHGMGERLALVSRDRSALVFPLTHIGGITWLFASLQSGCSLILMEAFHPQRTAEVLSRENVTLAGSGTPFHMAYVAAQRKVVTPIFPDVRGFPGGGAPKPPQLVIDVRELFDAPILSGYGLTEAPILTMASVDDSDDELATSEGKPMPGVELRCVTASGRICEPGQDGEIRARAPQLMLGYLDASLDVDAFDDEGFFRTGDLGHVDDRGNVVITGRLKDVIIRKGENVSAKEVEDMLFRHERVGDVAVIGLPDAERGEMVCAVVSAPADVDPIDFDEMLDFLKNEGLMIQKIPERLEVVDVMPRNPSGKIMKQQLKKEYS